MAGITPTSRHLPLASTLSFGDRCDDLADRFHSVLDRVFHRHSERLLFDSHFHIIGPLPSHVKVAEIVFPGRHGRMVAQGDAIAIPVIPPCLPMCSMQMRG